MKFFSSDIAVAIAWICGVAGFVYGLFQKQANIKLRSEINNYQIQLQNSLNTETQNNDARGIQQNGEKNVFTNNNSGGMNITM